LKEAIEINKSLFTLR